MSKIGKAMLGIAAALLLASSGSAAAQQAPVVPAYVQVQFPTVPRQFCSEADYWRFINEVINPQYLLAAENAEKAARFRAAVESAINDYVQSDRPVPASLTALRKQAAADYAAHLRLSSEIDRLRGVAKQTPIIDCSAAQAQSQLPSPYSRYGSMPYSIQPAVYRAYMQFRDGRERCDPQAMDAALSELARLAKLAYDAFEGIATSYPGPFDQSDTPENQEYWGAEADKNYSARMLQKARAEARDCPRGVSPTEIFGGIAGMILNPPRDERDDVYRQDEQPPQEEEPPPPE
jgi:hypothetical protein